MVTNGWRYFPHDIRKILIGHVISLEDFLNLRRVSRETKLLLENNITKLVPEKGDRDDTKDYRISPELVMKFHKIHYISPVYPIIISHEEDFILLAHHPTLIEAAFDLTTLDISLRQAVLIFFTMYPTFGNSRQDCQDSYRFTFFKRMVADYSLIEIIEGGLVFHNAPPSDDQEEIEFYHQLIKDVPICWCNIQLESDLSYLRLLPDLKRLILDVIQDTYKYPLVIGDSVYLLVNIFRTNAFLNNIIRYHATYPKFNLKHESQHLEPFCLSFVAEFIKSLFPARFDKIKEFFPIHIRYLRMILQLFPNLDTIKISLYSLRHYDPEWHRGLRINDAKIILINDIQGYPNIPRLLRHLPRVIDPNNVTIVDADHSF